MKSVGWDMRIRARRVRGGERKGERGERVEGREERESSERRRPGRTVKPTRAGKG